MTRFNITEIESNLAQNSVVGSLQSLTDSSKSANFSIEVRLMFFSLDRPMTKSLILNTKCQPKFLLLFHFKKRRVKAENCTTSFIALPCWNVNPKTQKMLD